MSTAPRYPADMGYAGLRMTADEFLSLGETPDRYELIDGTVVMSPSPTLRHQLLLVELLRQSLAWEQAHPGARLFPDTDLRLGTGKVYRPDLMIYAQGRIPTLPERLTVAPDVVVEIVSPATKALDLITKRDDYDAFGVGEYWALDPTDVTARVWRRSGGRMLEAGVERDTLECQVLPGLRVDLGVVRRAVG